MDYAAYANGADRLDSVVDEMMATTGGDTRAAILDLVRRQHEPQGTLDRSGPPGHAKRRPSQPIAQCRPAARTATA